MLVLLIVGSTVSIAFFNGLGCTVTKYASAAQRSTIDVSRTALIWIFFLLTPKSWGGKEYFYWLQLVGFVILIIGTLIFNEIVVIPALGFDKYTKNALNKNAAIPPVSYTHLTLPTTPYV